jgi:hypothetical protein
MLAQTSAPAPAVHMPFSVGFVCGPSVGRAPPFAIFGVQVCTLSSHQLPPEQSASTLQVPAGSQTPLTLHMPERQTPPPLATVQGPSPFA